MNIEVSYLELDNGVFPYLEWEAGLDTVARAAVRIRINRVRLGNFGDSHSVGKIPGLHELRLRLGPGYRIYFGKIKDTIVIILCGGDKRSQGRDIKKAEQYWQICKDSLKKKGGTNGKNKKL
ncbi:MAG TPA: type II toxin-antitoxin system RelE/ParE family toxin [Chlamydiales bacterium]|nr:type II toxin-antitoxin system RelE/ParE family toxin [Chlamydiales bacterium]